LQLRKECDSYPIVPEVHKLS